MPITKPFLILQLRPEDDISDNEFAALLNYGALKQQEVHRIRVEQNGIPSLNLANYSAVIVGGSPFDISTPEQQKSTIQKTIESDFYHLFDDIIAADFPFLGACSGCGLLGSYLQTPISGKFAEPVGTASVMLTEDGKNDPLLVDYPERIDVLLGHKEACDDTPTGATLLLRGDDCPVQMFRVGANVYATQFHPEGDYQGFTMRIHAYRNHGYFAPEQADELIAKVSQADTPYAKRLLKRFVQLHAR
ncbi:MAG: glutamine amidotransferase [Gammaproteobacteria bacterium]|nr:glutamine amidotransferase [Gammaproteobacteria bacterium]